MRLLSEASITGGRGVNRMPIVDLVRFASIFVVIGNHFFPLWIVTYIHSPLVKHLFLAALMNGPYGVDCFFVVSGFLITKLLAGQEKDFSKLDLKKFYVKRMARILPLLTLIVCTGFVFANFPETMMDKAKLRRFWEVSPGLGFWASLLTFTFNWFILLKSKSSLLGMHWDVLWSLAVEEQFYFFYPLTMRFFKTRRKLLVFLGGIAVSGVVFRMWVFFHIGNNWGWSHVASFSVFDQIAVGALLYFLWMEIQDELARKPSAAFFLMVAGMGICLTVYTATDVYDNFESIVAPSLLALGCALTILGGLHVPSMNSIFGRMISWPGKLSYGCYLWHVMIIFFFLPLVEKLGGFGSELLLLVSVFAFSYASYRWFELPMNNRMRAFFGIEPSRSL